MMLLVSAVLSAVDFVIPNAISDSVTFFLAHLNYVRGFVDVETLFLAIGTYIIFLGYYQIVKVGLWVYSMLPWIGKKAAMPNTAKQIRKI